MQQTMFHYFSISILRLILGNTFCLLNIFHIDFFLQQYKTAYSQYNINVIGHYEIY